MGRPLNGTLVETASGWRVEVPSARGSKRRVRRTFDSKSEAVAWRETAITALTQDRPLPDRASRPAPAGPEARGRTRFMEVAEPWHRELVLSNQAQVERTEAVLDDLRKIGAYFDQHGLFLETLDREEYLTILRQWAGTVVGPLNKRLSAARRDNGEFLEGYSPDGYADKRRTLNAVLNHARHVMKVPMQFELESIGRIPATTRPRKAKRAPITIAEAGELAAHLHAVHAFALLLMRLTGMRIGEVFGLRVCSYVSDPSRGRAVLVLLRQGGRKFLYRASDGGVVHSTERDSLKTLSSDRVVPIGSQLQQLVELVIAIFHTDPDTGVVDGDARLVPDLTGKGVGQGSFRSALEVAAARVGLDGIDEDSLLGVELGLGPHQMRAGFVSELSYTDIGEGTQRRYVGHQASTNSVRRAYLLDGRQFDELAPVAAAMEQAIAQELPDGLIVPTHHRCTTGSQPALLPRAAFLDAELAGVGWLVRRELTTATGRGLYGDTAAGVAVADVDRGDDVLDVRQVARLLDVAPGTARRMLREGELPSIPLPGGRDDQRGVRLDDAMRYLDHISRQVPLASLAQELGIALGSVHQVLPRLGITATKHRSVAVVDAPGAAAVREWQRRHEQQRREGLKLSEAAEQLRATPRAVERWIEQGQLQLLPRHGPDRYVTRASIDALAAVRRRPGRQVRR